jgi:hypothetical protein
VASRSLLILLLLNYLLVVGTGMIGRPAQVVNRPFSYVHSPDCQKRNYLKVACFDDCNGMQYHVNKGRPLPVQQLLTSLKGLDLHCLPTGQVAFTRPALTCSEPRLATIEVAVSSGHRSQIDFPPRRG